MKYLLKLEDIKKGIDTTVEVPASMLLEDFSIKIKVALGLPYADGGWHRFVARGAAYMQKGNLEAETEIMEESHINPGRYRYSDHRRLQDLFTVLGSVITYTQNDRNGDHKVRCTLMERLMGK